MARGLHKGFEQDRAVAVSLLPIDGQLACDPRQNFRRESFGLDPGQDQESGVVDDELQVLAPLAFLPANEALAPKLIKATSCSPAKML